MDTTALSQLVQRLQLQASKYQPGDESERQKLLTTLAELIRAIESPSERIARMCYTDTYTFIASRVLIDLKIFRIIAHAKASIKVIQLADETGADVNLIERLLKHICTQGFVQEVGPDEYVANGVTQKIA